MNLQSQTRLEASTYERSACAIGIVHLGFGAFHRAHQAVYVDQYMEQTGDLSWGIAAVNLRSADSAGFQASIANADGYLLKTTSPDGKVRYQLTRPHIHFADWSADAENAENLLNLDSVSTVSMTVTESGYFLDANGLLNVEDPAIASEISGGNRITVYGYLANALDRRAKGINKPINILCCDNIRANGKVLKTNFLRYLEASNQQELLDWVLENATFPCSMVDRITPRASDALVSEVDAIFPEHASTPIHGESFIQWVIEDNFAAAMPDLSKVGVQVVSDVDPFEEAKIRILNGGHTGLCYLGALAGHQTFDQAMHDPALRKHFDNFESKNVLPGLDIDLPFDRSEYLAEIAARFGNSAIADELARICMDGWSKMQIFIRPTLEGCLKQGIEPTFGYDCVASWYVYARRVAAGTMPITYVEPFWENLVPLLATEREEDFARLTALWSDLPEKYPSFASGIRKAIKQMEEKWPA